MSCRTEDKANLEEVELVVMVVAQVAVLEVTLLVVAKSVVDTRPQCSTRQMNWWETQCSSWWRQ